MTEATPGILDLNFIGSTTVYNNMGARCGQDPCPSPWQDAVAGECTGCDENTPNELRFTGLDSATDTVDLVIRNLTEYIPFNVQSSRVKDEFAQINIQCNFSNVLQFCFVEKVRTLAVPARGMPSPLLLRPHVPSPPTTF